MEFWYSRRFLFSVSSRLSILAGRYPCRCEGGGGRWREGGGGREGGEGGKEGGREGGEGGGEGGREGGREGEREVEGGEEGRKREREGGGGENQCNTHVASCDSRRVAATWCL